MQQALSLIMFSSKKKKRRRGSGQGLKKEIQTNSQQAKQDSEEHQHF
jgi:hypothetical protein